MPTNSWHQDWQADMAWVVASVASAGVVASTGAAVLVAAVALTGVESSVGAASSTGARSLAGTSAGALGPLKLAP